MHKKNKIVLDYICHHNIGNDKYVIDEFSLFARIIKENDNFIVYERYLKYGTLDMGKVTINKDEFYRYYRKANEDEIITLYK